mmetsp:Transcript_13236/g.21009  ORF Transcript_13236/g.21009 Transcript_13236/m.21009 type:complete len:160 (+) Transcript_13236:201-680(+)
MKRSVTSKLKQGSLQSASFRVVAKKATSAKLQVGRKEKVVQAVKGLGEETETQSHIPVFLHKVVGYDRAGERQISPNMLKVFEFVQANFIIPEDFEKDHQYGPLSGVCHERRVVNAYMHNLLRPAGLQKSDEITIADELKMCQICGDFGHWPRFCPEGF